MVARRTQCRPCVLRFYVREDGKLGHADKATTLDAARARAGRLKVALENQDALEIL
jgi:hypothetical protein